MATIPLYNTLGLGRKEQCDRPRRGQPFCQLVSREDVTLLQLPRGVCPNEVNPTSNGNSEIASEAEFNTFGQYDPGGKTAWTYSSGKAATTGNSKTFYVNASYGIGVDAQLDISVTLCPGVTMEVVFFTGTTPTGPPNETILGVISATGTYTFRHTALTATGSFAVRVIGTCGEGFSSYIEYFRLRSLTESECYYLAVKNMDGDIVYEGTDYRTGEDTVFWEMRWEESGLPDGCYTICINGVEFIENIFTLADNGTFEANSNGITSSVSTYGVSTNISYNGLKSWRVVYNTSGPTTLLETTIPITLDYKKRYRISAKVYIDVAPYQVQDAYIAFSSPDFSDISGAALAEPVTAREWTDIHIDFTPTRFPYRDYTFMIFATGSDWNTSDTTIYIDDIQLYDLDDVGAHCSECFILKDSHPCTLKLEWWNDSDAFGFYYPDTLPYTFKHSIRVAGSLAKTSYTGEKESFTDTEGEQIIVYADKKQVKELAINDMPEYMHEALAIGIDHDHFTINGDEYIIEENSYEPLWRKTSDLAPVVLDVRPKIQNLKNSYC